MERRDYVLREALEKNEQETARWQEYKADNETAIKNLDMFSKQLTVEVMVPIGKMAFMPGQLIHTNELLVGHYQGYFSACSAYKANEICQHRIKLADEHLKKLEIESDLWQNKLEKPILEGAMPNADEIEIVEDFDEEAHNNWLKEHKESVRKQKEEERILRSNGSHSDVDVFNKLEEREMLEELGLDPDNYKDNELSELLNVGEVKKTESKVCDKPTITDEEVFEMLNKLEAKEQNEEVEIDAEAEENLQNTNDVVKNLMKQQTVETTKKTRIGADKKVEEPVEEQDGMDENEEENKDDFDSDQPAEVKIIREQLTQLPVDQQEEFLISQLQIIRSKMRKLEKEHFINDEITHLMNVVVCLEDDLEEMLFSKIETVSTDELSDESESLSNAIDDNKKRRISFAETDEKLIFRKEETVAQMMTKKKEVITLDAPFKHVQKELSIKEEPLIPATTQIMQKVEQNLEFVKEHQSVQDFDLVNQILEASTGRINTLHISFQHSDAVAATTEFDEEIPGNPADLYKLYKKALAKTQSVNEFPIYVNSFEGEQELKVPILKEEARKTAYNDPRAEFSKVSTALKEDTSTIETKSILRNKSAVEIERRAKGEKLPRATEVTNNKSKNNRNKKKKPRTIDDEIRDMSAYHKVMQDLVEKEPTIPEPLPEGKFIDAHAPKKRVSRFKEQRSMNKT